MVSTRSALALAALAAGSLACARPAAAPGGPGPAGREPSRPALVLAITVDQMRADYLDRYAHQYSGAFARLLREGAVFPDAYQDHGVTETAPGHASILSGRHPASTGIIRNDEGVPDSTSPLLDFTGPGASPHRFRGTALFDWLRARYPAARALSVSRKDRSAILTVGRSRAEVYWFVVGAGQFTTSRWYAESLPSWVREVNAEVASWRAPGSAWNPLLDASAYPEPDSVPYENHGREMAFPHPIVEQGAPGGGRRLFQSPYMDSITLALALRGVQALGLGRGPRPGPDLIAISLSAIDDIGHAFGPESREVHDALLRVDRWLGAFLDSLAALRGGRLLVALTADHGVTPFPEWSRQNGVGDADWTSVDTLVRRYRAELASRAGPGRWIPYREVGMIALDRAGLARQGVNVDSLVETMRSDLLRVRGVGRVDTRRSVAAADTAGDAVARRWRHMLSDEVPGELLVTLRPGWAHGSPLSDARHGQPTDQDAHVVLAFWGRGIRAGRFAQRASTVDIAPTLAQVLGIRPMERVDGRVLVEALTNGAAGGASLITR